MRNLSEREYWYDALKRQRQELLNLIPLETRNAVEERIRQELLKIMTIYKNDYFSYSYLLEIPEIQKWIDIYSVTSDRNKGKTHSSEREAEKVVKKGKKFAIVRVIPDECDLLANTENKAQWFISNSWEAKSVGVDGVYNIINKNSKLVVGYIFPISTSYKIRGVKYPDIELVICDEFNSDARARSPVKFKFRLLVDLMITIQRHNPNMKMILQANYLKQGDDILSKFGIGIEQLSADKFFHIDWISRAIIWFIPPDVFKIVKKEKNLQERLALLDEQTFKDTYGGSFTIEDKPNVINEDKIVEKIPLFSITYSTLNNVNAMATAYFWRIEAIDGKRYIWVNDTDYYDEFKNNYVLSPQDLVARIEYRVIDSGILVTLYNHWLNKQLKTSDDNMYKFISNLLARGIREQGEYLEEMPLIK